MVPALAAEQRGEGGLVKADEKERTPHGDTFPVTGVIVYEHVSVTLTVFRACRMRVSSSAGIVSVRRWSQCLLR